jgi:preprotein translocase subunit SecA
MAGRGTDIILGGVATNTTIWSIDSKAVSDSGGLYVIGTERYESRRIDNQLRGRSGRQGDPGSSLFYLSIEDDLLRVFISSQYLSFLRRLWSDETEFIQHKVISSAIKNAQTKVEAYYADVRKQLLEFDDILNEQRIIVSKKRFIMVYLDDVCSLTSSFIYFVVKKLHLQYFEGFVVLDLVLFNKICTILNKQYNIKVSNHLKDTLKYKESLEDSLHLIYTDILETYKNKRKSYGYYEFCKIEKSILLYIFDLKWREYLEKVEHLKQSIDLQRYIQKDPKQEYRRRVYFLFSAMLDDIRQEFCRLVFKIKKKT